MRLTAARRFVTVGLVSVAMMSSPLGDPADAYCGSLCSPSGLVVLETLEGSASVAVATSTTGAGVSGISLSHVLGGTAGTAGAAVTLVGWPGDDIDIQPGVQGLETGPANVGWVPDPSQSVTPAGEYWTSGGSFFKATVDINYTTESGGTITINRYFGTGLQGINTSLATVYSNPMEPVGTEIKHLGRMTGWQTFGAPGTKNSSQTQTFPPGITGFVVAGHRWYAPGQPNRPNPERVGVGIVTRYASCVGANDTVYEISHRVPVDIAEPGSNAAPALLCPSGTVVSSFWSTWTPDRGVEQTLTPVTGTPEWVRQVPDAYPDCLVDECTLQLWSQSLDGPVSCGSLAVDCPDWYVSADRQSRYKCTWGVYEVALHYCSVLRDPGFVLPNARIDDRGNVAYSAWPPLKVDSAPVQRAASRLVQRYGDDSCEVLVEAVRIGIALVATPDLHAICTTGGVVRALAFAQGSSTAMGLLDIVPPLMHAADGSRIDARDPECEQFAEDGTCIEGDAVPDAEPEPDPVSGAIKPPQNCLDDRARQALEDSMPEQGHHMATWYGLFGVEFAQIFAQYGLDINGAWNVKAIPHRGPHPWSYHNWVLTNVRRASASARLVPAELQADVFRRLFTQYVVDVVERDPTIVRAAYWKCRDDYRWR